MESTKYDAFGHRTGPAFSLAPDTFAKFGARPPRERQRVYCAVDVEAVSSYVGEGLLAVAFVVFDPRARTLERPFVVSIKCDPEEEDPKTMEFWNNPKIPGNRAVLAHLRATALIKQAAAVMIDTYLLGLRVDYGVKVLGITDNGAYDFPSVDGFLAKTLNRTLPARYLMNGGNYESITDISDFERGYLAALPVAEAGAARARADAFVKQVAGDFLAHYARGAEGGAGVLREHHPLYDVASIMARAAFYESML
jgi:hypothetical protein